MAAPDMPVLRAKYQRRRCRAYCPLASYVAPNQPKMSQNAYKLFGVCNLLKIIKESHSHDQLEAEAMRSIINQSNIRQIPVRGCFGIVICQLRHQI